MNLPAYPKYKSSGVEWLGEVPKDWEVKRLKYSASINDEALPETTPPEFEFNYVDIGNVDSGEGITAEEQLTFDTAPSRARRVVRDGDTIVSTVRTYLRAIAPIRNPRENLIVSTGFAVIRPRKIDPHFLSYALRESSFVETVVARSVGVSYPAVNASEVGTIPIPLPPTDKQRAIADFLDWETARLDRLVGKKRELIERLKEKRTALISRTVTRGLNRNVKLKPCGIEWLADIPEHWTLRTLRHHIDLLTGFAFQSEFFSFADGIKLVRGDNVTEGELRWGEKTRYWAESVSHLSMFFLANGDVLIGMDGSKVGKNYAMIEQADLPLLLVQRVARLRVDHRFTARFLFYLIGSELFRTWVELVKTEPAVPHISPHDIRAFPVAVPLIDEQHAIAEYLDRETAKIDKMMEKIEAAIEKLQEYRTALITAAVTGKIDVRKANTPAGSTPSRAASTMPA